MRFSPGPSPNLAFSMLLDGQTNGAPVARRLILKACLWGWMNMDVAGCYLFNTSHTGLENKGYAALLRRWGARPIFVVHDLIPVTHPEYCGLGARERHKARIHNALAMGAELLLTRMIRLMR